MLRNRPKYRGSAIAEFNANMTKAAKRAQGWYVLPALLIYHSPRVPTARPAHSGL